MKYILKAEKVLYLKIWELKPKMFKILKIRNLFIVDFTIKLEIFKSLTILNIF